MVNIQRCNLLDASSPNPSVETLFHAFLPHKFIDHTHASAVLAITDQPDGAAICRKLYGKRVALVDYEMPGFGLAKKAAAAYKAAPDCEGDRKSVVEGKGGSVRGDLGGRRIIKKKKQKAKE